MEIIVVVAMTNGRRNGGGCKRVVSSWTIESFNLFHEGFSSRVVLAALLAH